MKIRDIGSKDFEKVFRLVADVFADTPTAFNFKEIPGKEAFRFLFENKLDMLSDGTSVDIIAEEDGKILANCEIIRIDKNTGILGIIVGLENRRAGIGNALLKRALLDAGKQGIIRVLAEVSSDNKAGICFLERNGFVPEKLAQVRQDDSGFTVRRLTFVKRI